MMSADEARKLSYSNEVRGKELSKIVKSILRYLEEGIKRECEYGEFAHPVEAEDHYAEDAEMHLYFYEVRDQNLREVDISRQDIVEAVNHELKAAGYTVEMNDWDSDDRSIYIRWLDGEF